MTWRKIEGAKQQKPEICAITGNQVSTYVQSSENNDVYATPFEAYMTCKGWVFFEKGLIPGWQITIFFNRVDASIEFKDLKSMKQANNIFILPEEKWS